MLSAAFEKRFSDPRAMLRECQLAAGAAANTGDTPVECLASAFLGNALRVVGRLRDARQAFRACFRSLNDCPPAMQARILELAASLETRCGTPEKAAEYLERAIDLRTAHAPEGLPLALLKLADVQSELGRFEDGLATISEALDALPESATDLRLIGFSNGAEMLCGMGRHAEALAALKRLEPRYSDAGHPSFLAHRELVLAHAHQGLGNKTLARAHYKRAAAGFQVLGDAAKLAAALLEMSELAYA